MATNESSPSSELDDRKRRARRNAILLALTSFAFYVAYIVMSIK